MNRKQYFKSKLTDFSTTDDEGLGTEREEFDNILGLRRYRWIRNVKGSAFAAGESTSWEKRMAAPVSVTAVNAGDPPLSTTSISVAPATFTARTLAGLYFRVHNDAGGAGAAPEGEVHRIKTNTAQTITLPDDDPLTTSIGAADTFVIFRPWYVIASADADTRPEWAGVSMSAIPDQSYGWIQCAGIHTQVLVVAAGTAVAQGDLMKPGAGILVTGADNADNAECVATCLANGLQSGTVLRKALMMLFGN